MEIKFLIKKWKVNNDKQKSVTFLAPLEIKNVFLKNKEKEIPQRPAALHIN